MDYNNGIRAARTGYCWTVQNTKLPSPIPDPPIVLPRFLPLVFKQFQGILSNLSILSHLSFCLYPIWTTPIPLPFLPDPFACNSVLFSPVPHLSFLFFPQTPHLQSCLAFLYHVLSLHLQLTSPFQSLYPSKISQRSQATGAGQREVIGKLIVKHQWHSRDARNGCLVSPFPSL